MNLNSASLHAHFTISVFPLVELLIFTGGAAAHVSIRQGILTTPLTNHKAAVFSRDY